MIQQKGFLDRLNYRVNTLPSTMPLDVALMGTPLEEASCIDANDAIRCIASTESVSESLTFADLTDARIPIPSDNVFVQFHTAAASIQSDFPGWLGVHIVPFDTARHSRMFSLLGKIPERIDQWPIAYAMVIYREWPLEISIGPAGMLIGLDEKGTVIDAAMFAISLQEGIGDQKGWEHVSRLTAWITYLTLCVFTMVNQGESPMIRKGPGLWQI